MKNVKLNVCKIKIKEVIGELLEVAEGSRRFMKSVPAPTDYLDELISKTKAVLSKWPRKTE